MRQSSKLKAKFEGEFVITIAGERDQGDEENNEHIMRMVMRDIMQNSVNYYVEQNYFRSGGKEVFADNEHGGKGDRIGHAKVEVINAEMTIENE
jgi:hypothetical protein